MKKVTVYITLKAGVLDPQGKAIQESLTALGYEGVTDTRVGKVIELNMEDGPDLEVRIKDMCNKLLANPVMEDYRLEVEEAVQA